MTDYKQVYTQRKNEVTAFLAQSIQEVRALGRSDEAQSLQVLMDNVEKDVFSIVVVGEFSAGKSTFLNAMMHKRVLPSNSGETTATVNFLRHASCAPNGEAGIVYYRSPEGRTETLQDLELSTVENVVSTKGDDGEDTVAARIDHVDLFFDSDFLKDGVMLVDSPGLSGLAAHHREITEEQIRRSNACIFLFNACQPGSKSNFEFLHDLKNWNSNTFFALNKVDQINEGEGKSVEEVTEYIKKTYCEQFPEEKEMPHIWPISAKKALAARDKSIQKIKGPFGVQPIETEEDRRALENASRMEAFEDRLWDYLTNGERARDQLCGPLNRALNALGREEAVLDNQIKALNQQMGSEELGRQRDALQKEIDELQDSMDGNSAELSNSIRTAVRDLLESADAKCSALRSSVSEEIREQDDPEDLELYSLELSRKLKDKYNRIARHMDEELRDKLMEIVSIEYGKYAGQLTQKLNESDMPLEIRLEPKTFEVTMQAGKNQEAVYEKACKELSDKIRAQEAKRDQLELNFIQAAEMEQELQKEKTRLDKMEQSRDEFRDMFHIPDPKVKTQQNISEERRKGLIGIVATVLIGKKTIVEEKITTDTAEKEAAEKERNKIIGEKDDAISAEKEKISGLETQAQGMEKSTVLKGRKDQEERRLAQLRQERSELLAKQNREMSVDAQKRLRKLRFQILEKVDENSGEIQDSIRKYLRERQGTYVDIVANLVNMNLSRELEQKQTELDQIIQTIKSDSETRAQKLDAAQKDLQQTRALIKTGSCLVQELQGSMKATLDKEKVKE